MTTQDDPDLEAILKNKAADNVAAATRPFIGLLPIIGPFLSELVTNVIPNQRIDRVTHYLKTLSEKLSKLHEVTVRQQLTNPGFSGLIEESLQEAIRSVSEERRVQIASLVANGLDASRINLIGSQHLLGLLGELNDIEVLWLRFYVVETYEGDEEFRQKHRDLLRRPRPTYESPQSEIDEEALVDSYHGHLARLGLLRPIARKRSAIKQERPPSGGTKHVVSSEWVVDRETGLPEVSGYEITPLGRLLLTQIDLMPAREAPPR